MPKFSGVKEEKFINDPPVKARSKKGAIKRLDVPGTPGSDWGEHDIPELISSGYVKNVGAVDVSIRFEDDLEEDYWELKPNDITPPGMPFPGGKKLLFKGVSPSGKIALILW